MKETPEWVRIKENDSRVSPVESFQPAILMNYQLTPLIKSPTGDYHIAKDDTVRCWVCSGSGDVKDKKTGEMRVCRACMGKGRVKV